MMRPSFVMLHDAHPSSQPDQTRSQSRRVQHRWLLVILAIHFLLALVYSIIIPPWEAHDEWAHYRHAAYIAENLALPDPSQRLTNEFEFDEASQPPLYYILAAVPMLAVDTTDGYRPTVNPYAMRGTGIGGVNFVIHDPDVESWPWRGTILALHLGRLVSVVISTAGLWLTFALVRLLSPRRRSIPLVATAIQAFAPQYVFLSAVITNDILLIVLETALLYLSIRILIEGATLRSTALLGFVTGLTLLTKYLALAVLPIPIIVLAIIAWRQRHSPEVKQSLKSAIVLLGIIVGIGGLLLLRNQRLTGMLLPRDPVAQSAVINTLAEESSLQLNWRAIPAALQYGFETYWVSFGWGNVATDDWVYLVWFILWLGGMIGFGIWLTRRKARPTRSVLLLSALFVFATISLPLIRELIHESVFLRGRYILSTLPLIAWMMAEGWAELSGRYWPTIRKLLLAWPAGLSIFLIPSLLIPAYKPPSTLDLSSSALPDQAIYARFDEAAELLRYDIWPAESVAPGDGLAVTLTWRVLSRTEEPYTLAIHLVGAGQQSYGSVTTYPGDGNAATTVWTPGTVFRETYWLVVQDNGPTPTGGHIAVTLFNEHTLDTLPVFDPEGRPAGDTVRFGTLRIDPPPSLVAATPAEEPTQELARFGDLLVLTTAKVPNIEFQAGWGVPVLLRWRALRPVTEEIKLSIQLLTPEGVWLAGSDGPANADLPPSLWRAGDILHITRWLPLPEDLPPGEYQLIATFYRAADLERLPATDPSGSPLPSDAVIIDNITVSAPSSF
ncbi:MAG: glycosyltransferase family 39 protein [Chloroflexi bacterium]|nr:glycosyltransferase family 39 protein [Chloroflexota bacterium]